MIDVIIILGGGLDSDGSPHKWVKKRLDKALEEYTGKEYVMTCTRGTVHKPQMLDNKGFPVDECIPMARYLEKKGIPSQNILLENMSFDTIGNAYFSRMIHVEPMRLKNILIITSEFHMPRSMEAFRWVYNLTPTLIEYNLDFMSVSDEGIDPDILNPRMERERQSIKKLLNAEKNIKTLQGFHKWFFTKHEAYAFGKKPERITGKERETY
ncbi:MAG: YdcF family protein [Candidatus Aenigmatarchaeota archaeon]|nr:YdcF family protein [Nanoarchaeota archaeon]